MQKLVGADRDGVEEEDGVEGVVRAVEGDEGVALVSGFGFRV